MCDWLTDREAGNMASAKKKKNKIKREHECGGRGKTRWTITFAFKLFKNNL